MKIDADADVRLQKKIEMACPQIIGEDADLWRKFIERDFGRDVLLKCPSDPPKGWSRVYDVR